jgi:hypothetical protein
VDTRITLSLHAGYLLRRIAKPRFVRGQLSNWLFYLDEKYSTNGHMLMSKILGKWKITEMEQWDLDFIDEQGEGYFEFDSNNQGYFMFGYVEGSIDFRESENEAPPKIEYSWSGQDEMDEASGRGWFELANEDELYGMIYFHQGDESWVKAKRIK